MSKSIELTPEIQDLLRQFNELNELVRAEYPQERRVALAKAWSQACDKERDLYTLLYNGDVSVYAEWQAAKKECEATHAASNTCNNLLAKRNILSEQAQRAFGRHYCVIKSS